MRERTHGGDANHAFFTDTASYRRLVVALPDRETCNTIAWTWTENTTCQVVLLLILCESTVQQCSARKEANTGSDPEDPGSRGLFEEFALRDIYKGEEMRRDHARFLGNYWDDLGL